MPKVKAVLVGDAGVGKTCIAERISKNSFNESTYATVGAANLTVTIQTNNREVIFNIWDTAGQERYRSLTPMYFAGAQVAILVFDITSEASFSALDNFCDLLQQRAPTDCVFVLVGNKSDMESKRGVTKEAAFAYSQKIGAIFYTETSAMSGDGVQKLFNDIADSGMITFQEEEPDFIADIKTPEPEKKGCC